MSSLNSEPRRRRGVWAGLNRARIVETARDMNPETLTLQAVANELGVDRKAVSHHVKDRDSLLELVAIDAFSTTFRAGDVPEGAGWQETCRAYAVSMRDGLLATGSLASYFRLTSRIGSDSSEVLGPAEIVLESLLDAGFDERSSARALTMLANLTMSFVRDRVLVTTFGEHPQLGELRNQFSTAGPGDLRALDHLVGSGVSAYDDDQFDWYVDVTIHGMADLLATRSRAPLDAD